MKIAALLVLILVFSFLPTFGRSRHGATMRNFSTHARGKKKIHKKKGHKKHAFGLRSRRGR